ncbi:B3 domain-containing protein [Cephalotus follicularis]|uniref:B3 domain-containing protein n=1 Tax=Cephalotus follicularis TaxID=3775 RepID=A0A1Q3CKL9_CEPFO|nr:B3 domain-containing protein [Cephalotus follicularis]
MVKSSRRVSSSGNSYDFFKVYLPDFSSNLLEIPPAFVEHFNGIIPNEAMLKDHTGRLWHVRLEELDGAVIIGNGWQPFASEHSLEYGDFLIFEYDGISMFDVKIFGINGCKKEQALETYRMTTGSSGNSPLEEPKELVAYAKPDNPSFASHVDRQACSRIYIPKKVLKEYGIKLHPDMKLRDQDGKKWSVVVSFRDDGRIYLTVGWNDFRQKHKVRMGDKCIFEFVCTSGNICKEMKVQVVHKFCK